MIRTKDIYADICNNSKAGHRLTDSEISGLQNHLMQMYKDLEEICERHGLQVSLAYGNVIGAMRHNGWIPWDDDLDVMMPREDYDLLLSKYIGELPKKYITYSVHTPEGPYERFAKIVDTTTTFVSLMGESGVHEGVFLDIFPIDNFNPRKPLLKLRKYWMYFMMYTATSVKQYLNHNESYRQLMYASKEGKANYRLRNLWGMCFSFIKPSKWYKWIDSFSKEKKSTGLVHVPIGSALNFAGYDKTIFFPPKKMTLNDGTEVLVPNQPEKYLDIIYHNWREIPEESKRWHHFVREFCLNNNNK